MASIDLIIKDKSKIEPILSHARGLIERAIVAGDVVIRLCRPNRNTAHKRLVMGLADRGKPTGRTLRHEAIAGRLESVDVSGIRE